MKFLFGCEYAETVSSLAMNTLVCSVKSSSEVSSRDYLVANRNRVVFYLEDGLETPQNRTETRERSFWKKFFPKLELHLKKGRSKAGMKKSEHYPTME